MPLIGAVACGGVPTDTPPAVEVGAHGHESNVTGLGAVQGSRLPLELGSSPGSLEDPGRAEVVQIACVHGRPRFSATLHSPSRRLNDLSKRFVVILYGEASHPIRSWVLEAGGFLLVVEGEGLHAVEDVPLWSARRFGIASEAHGVWIADSPIADPTVAKVSAPWCVTEQVDPTLVQTMRAKTWGVRAAAWNETASRFLERVQDRGIYTRMWETTEPEEDRRHWAPFLEALQSWEEPRIRLRSRTTRWRGSELQLRLASNERRLPEWWDAEFMRLRFADARSLGAAEEWAVLDAWKDRLLSEGLEEFFIRWGERVAIAAGPTDDSAFRFPFPVAGGADRVDVKEGALVVVPGREETTLAVACLGRTAQRAGQSALQILDWLEGRSEERPPVAGWILRRTSRGLHWVPLADR